MTTPTVKFSNDGLIALTPALFLSRDINDAL